MAETKAMNLREKLRRIHFKLNSPQRSFESIQEALLSMEKTYNVTIVLTYEMIEVSERIYVKAKATIMDCDSEDIISTTAFARETDAKKGMNYALSALFLLNDTKNVDFEEYQAQSKEKASEAKSQPQTAPAKHSKDEIRAKYRELIEYCKENDFDITSVARDFSLNAKSTYEEFDTALKKLIYTVAKNEHKGKNATEGMMEV